MPSKNRIFPHIPTKGEDKWGRSAPPATSQDWLLRHYPTNASTGWDSRVAMAGDSVANKLSTYGGYRFIGSCMFSVRSNEYVNDLAVAHSYSSIELDNFVLFVFWW
ncbi:hypothetical protein TNCV_4987081 [Trichonephila clavipes]|nr:hypothetical protein TNCV_4987081 [Trichonephila clavipes]